MKRFTRILQILIVVALVVVGVQGISAQSWSESMYYGLYELSYNEYWSSSYLSPGTVIVVQPGTSWWNVTRYSAAENLLTSNQVRTIVLAGVGSSSRGTAAMAKRAARTLNQRVGGIVTGWGDYSTTQQALEGYTTARSANQSGSWYNNAASSKLMALYSSGARPTRLIGHSKGAMDSANALFRMAALGRGAQYGQTTFITFGMGVFVPGGVVGPARTRPKLRNFRQYLGTSDPLGDHNTVNRNPMINVSGKGHSLSPAMSMHISMNGRLGL